MLHPTGFSLCNRTSRLLLALSLTLHTWWNTYSCVQKLIYTHHAYHGHFRLLIISLNCSFWNDCTPYISNDLKNKNWLLKFIYFRFSPIHIDKSINTPTNNIWLNIPYKVASKPYGFVCLQDASDIILSKYLTTLLCRVHLNWMIS